MRSEAVSTRNVEDCLCRFRLLVVLSDFGPAAFAGQEGVMSHATNERQPRASAATESEGGDAPDSFRIDAADGTEQATEEESVGDAGGTSAPTQDQDDRNRAYTADRLRSIDRRTDLRTAERHASWREVAATCHVKAGLGR